jgi:hypothetical protein
MVMGTIPTSHDEALVQHDTQDAIEEIVTVLQHMTNPHGEGYGNLIIANMKTGDHEVY